MKKLLSVAVVVVFLFAVVGTATAAKPAGNLAGAQTYAWHLSGAVMPVPPYGSGDIPGSDTASKLIVNQPNGNTEVAITGVMNGLTPNTTYTVYLANGYTPHVTGYTPYVTGWNVTGNWGIAIEYLGTDYVHTTALTQTGTSITGALAYLGNNKNITSGSVIGNAITIVAEYTENGPGTVTLTGTIAGNGTMSGTWSDTWGEVIRTGTWTTTYGNAAAVSTVPFTFTTDANGSGSWHINLKDSDFAAPGDYTLSVWINGAGGTMLISDTFKVTR